MVAWLSLSLAPQGAMQFQLLLNKQDAMTQFDTLGPGSLSGALSDGTRVTYTETLTEDRTNLGGVFILQEAPRPGPERPWHFRPGGRAAAARKIHPDGNRYLILENGYRYDGSPGQADYRAIKYDAYGVLLPKAGCQRRGDRPRRHPPPRTCSAARNCAPLPSCNGAFLCHCWCLS